MKSRILIIDDEERIRKSFRLILEDAGYTVDAATSGDEGLALAARMGPDLILLDLKMPAKDGVQTLRELKPIVPEVPIYIVTAFHDEYFGALKKAVEDGISFDLLRKPISSDELLLAVKGVLDASAARVELLCLLRGEKSTMVRKCPSRNRRAPKDAIANRVEIKTRSKRWKWMTGPTFSWSTTSMQT